MIRIDPDLSRSDSIRASSLSYLSNKVLAYWSRLVNGKPLASISNIKYKTMYKKGTKIEENIYDIDGFQIRFFTMKDIKFFMTADL
jgi:hypothetical protein